MFSRYALLAAALAIGSAGALAAATPATMPADSTTPANTAVATPAMHTIAQPPATEPSETATPSPKPVTNPPTTRPVPPDVGAAPTTHPGGPAENYTNNLGKVVITSSLDQARSQIAPSLGGTIYTLGPEQIQTTPQGQNAPFQQVLLRLPSVVMDSFGQYHIRGEHADVTYRINGIILPEPLNGFGQELDTHIIQSVTLIDGSLPAQFGFRTAGIVDVTAKSGTSLTSNEISIYGGTYDTYEPSFEVGGVDGKWDYFISGSYKHDSLGIENPTPARQAIHDDTSQSHLFAYASYHIDDTSRLSFLVNSYYGNFQIPNVPGAPQAYSLAGVPYANSADLNENQNEQQYYGVVSYQKSEDRLSLQASAYFSYGATHFIPDPVNDLIFQGVASNIENNFTADGLQIDSSYELNDQHTLRFGTIADYTVERNDTNTLVFPTDPVTGAQTSDVPFSILDDSKNDAISSGIYLQDEWKLAKGLTLNYGLRYDRFDASFDHEDQVSPRVNVVWKATDQTTFHAGYSRYFDPPPVQYVSPSTIAKFTNTTNAPANFLDDPPKVERSNYYDAGITEQLNKAWTVNVDAFYKQAKNLVDLGQFGTALILSPFNYAQGYVYGSELSTNYRLGPASLFGNFAYEQTGGKNIDSQQFLIDSAELAYIQNNYIHLDHESEYTASAGASYQVTPNDLAYVDMIYASGLRSGFANTLSEPSYYPINVGYQHVFHTNGPHDDTVTLRFDVINLFDEVYQIRSGTGVGVAAPQYGQRRTFLLGLAYNF